MGMICPRCGRGYDDKDKFCPTDGTQLINADEDTMAGDASEATMIGSSEDAIPAPQDIAIRVRDPHKARELRPGSMIGDYRIEEQIGQGGMATVYRCVHPFSGKKVAVKILHPRLPSESAAVARFMQEARAINQIGHRNIVDILEFNQLMDGRHYLVMELFQGVTLQRYLVEHKVLQVRKVLAIIKSVASALDAAHAKGFIHRDLKPENIILERADSDVHMLVKLLDFGAAKYLTPEESEDEEQALQTKTGIILGTPDYMSPEQCDGAALDHRTDVYSLGMVAFQCLTGKLPFTGENFFDVMAKRLTQPAPRPTSMAPHLHPAFDAPLLKALEKDPARRFDRAGELAHALEVAAYEAASSSGQLSAEDLAALVPSNASGPSQMMSALPRRTTQAQAIRPDSAGGFAAGPSLTGPAQASPAQAGPAPAGFAQGTASEPQRPTAPQPAPRVSPAAPTVPGPGAAGGALSAQYKVPAQQTAPASAPTARTQPASSEAPEAPPSNRNMMVAAGVALAIVVLGGLAFFL